MPVIYTSTHTEETCICDSAGRREMRPFFFKENARRRRRWGGGD